MNDCTNNNNNTTHNTQRTASTSISLSVTSWGLSQPANAGSGLSSQNLCLEEVEEEVAQRERERGWGDAAAGEAAGAAAMRHSSRAEGKVDALSTLTTRRRPPEHPRPLWGRGATWSTCHTAPSCPPPCPPPPPSCLAREACLRVVCCAGRQRANTRALSRELPSLSSFMRKEEDLLSTAAASWGRLLQPHGRWRCVFF